MGGDEARRRDTEQREAEPSQGTNGDRDERAERDGAEIDTAHEDVVPFDKESRLDEPDSRG